MVTREINLKESRGTFHLFRKNFNRKGQDLSGISALRQLLSNERIKILDLVKEKNPSSLYHLSKLSGRDFKAVYGDAKLLQRFGFLELVEEKTKGRMRLKPVLVTDTITINIKI